MYIPEKPTPMPAGEFPAHVLAACLMCQVQPGDLMAWCVRQDAVTLILPTGQKVLFEIAGPWHEKARRLLLDDALIEAGWLPFGLPLILDDAPPAASHMPKVGSLDPLERPFSEIDELPVPHPADLDPTQKRPTKARAKGK